MLVSLCVSLQGCIQQDRLRGRKTCSLKGARQPPCYSRGFSAAKYGEKPVTKLLQIACIFLKIVRVRAV
ncbi:hypothetical protein HOLleu_26240 [Holothuria leucospilota]|uniref:Uncharacterized protein n=1 Tax=Holothuria leucospilota TaxID=206669 RepID=A0A9Q1BU67_HOLLE|nr:hypothetical protein HOLleu_26240 [Holothuria leucospilota]